MILAWAYGPGCSQLPAAAAAAAAAAGGPDIELVAAHGESGAVGSCGVDFSSSAARMGDWNQL